MADSNNLINIENGPSETKSTEPSKFRATEVKDSDELCEMYCEECNRDGVRVTAYAFCVSCVSYLCSTCLKYHGKFLPGHKSLEGDKMPLDICIEKCQTHNSEIIKFYCTTCSKFVCSLCKREQHTDSCKMKYLPDFVKDLENGEEFKELMANKNDIAGRLSNSKAALDKKYERIRSVTADAKCAIMSEKEALFTKFDQEVCQMEEKIQLLKKEDDLRLGSMKANLDALKTETDLLSDNLKQLPLFPNNRKYKLFIKLKQLGVKVKQVKDSIECLTKDCSVNGDVLESGLRVQAKDLTENVKKFGTLMRSYNDNSNSKTDNEQAKVAYPLDDINVRAGSDQNNCSIISCCLLSEQILIVCDRSNCSLKLIDVKKRKPIFVRPVKMHPEAVTKISETQIAMAQPYDKNENRSIIQFLTVTKTKTLSFQKRYILTEMCCYDIAYINDDRLVISMVENHEGKLQILSLSGRILANIEYNDEGNKLFSRPDWIALAAGGKCVYVSDWYNECITEIDIDSLEDRKFGHRFWHAHGITTDNDGFIYVCEEGTGRVHVFHSDDASTNVLLDNPSENWQPLSMCFSLTDDTLYVGQDGLDCIKVYRITKK